MASRSQIGLVVKGEFPSSNPSPCHQMGLCLVVPDSIPLRFVNSQLVSLPPVGIFNKFLFNLQFQCPQLFVLILDTIIRRPSSDAGSTARRLNQTFDLGSSNN